MNFEGKSRFLNVLSRVLSDSEIYRETLAWQNEERGRELLLAGDVEGALEKFRASVEEKSRLLAERVARLATREEASKELTARRLELARNYLGVALLERFKKRFDAARSSAEAAIAALDEIDVDDEETRDEKKRIRRETGKLLKGLDAI